MMKLEPVLRCHYARRVPARFCASRRVRANAIRLSPKTMSLLTCPECGGEVSNRAAACPHCGAPVEDNAPDQPRRKSYSLRAWGKKYPLAAVAAVIGLAMLALIILYAFLSSILSG